MGHNAPLNCPYIENYMLHVLIYSKGEGNLPHVCMHLCMCLCVCVIRYNSLELGRLSASCVFIGQIACIFFLWLIVTKK